MAHLPIRAGALSFAHNEQKIANEVYGGRTGNTAPDDGFAYRGRGLLQLTGNDSYAQATKILRDSYPRPTSSLIPRLSSVQTRA